MRDLLARRWSQAREYLVGRKPWLEELGRYYGRGMSEQEFWVRYTLGRQQVSKLWHSKPRRDEAEYRSFYAETDYWVLRQMYYHRHSSFHWIERALPRSAAFCEYGCGVAPVTAWLRPRRPSWYYVLVDVPSHTATFAQWRFPNVRLVSPGFGEDLPLVARYDGIACLEVLEHVVNPLQVVVHLVEHLKPGGSLFMNFIEGEPEDENLIESVAQRPAVIDYLESALIPVRSIYEHPLRAHYMRRAA